MTPVRLTHWGGKRQSKFNNRRVKTAAGVSFDSQSEAQRWGELLLLQRAGEIRDLKLHPRFSLDVNGVHICDYIADYGYQCPVKAAAGTKLSWISVTEDRKAGAITQTDVFKLKRKLMKALHNIDILITGEKT